MLTRCNLKKCFITERGQKMINDMNLLNELPELRHFMDRRNLIEKQLISAEDETEPGDIKDSFKTMVRLKEELYSDLINYYTKEHSRQFKAINKMLEEAQKQHMELVKIIEYYQQSDDELNEKFVTCMFTDPRRTIEGLLRVLERKMKADSADGYNNWQWSLSFKFHERIRMAWKLIWGIKSKWRCEGDE